MKQSKSTGASISNDCLYADAFHDMEVYRVMETVSLVAVDGEENVLLPALNLNGLSVSERFRQARCNQIRMFKRL